MHDSACGDKACIQSEVADLDSKKLIAHAMLTVGLGAQAQEGASDVVCGAQKVAE